MPTQFSLKLPVGFSEPHGIAQNLRRFATLSGSHLTLRTTLTTNSSASVSRLRVAKRVFIHSPVPVCHSLNGEVVFDVFSHCPWVNLQITGAFCHLDNRTANITGCSLTNDFAHRATRHGENGSAAGHGFYHNQPKRFVPLDWEEHSHGVTQKIVLHSEIGNPRVLHEPPINLRLDLSFKVITILRLNVAGNLQRDSGSLCHINS